MNKNFYYCKKNPKISEMELDKKGYPIWKDSREFVHRKQAEKYILKRKLKSNEEVHHIDGDKLNFDIENLIVLSKEDHMKIEKDLWGYKNIVILHFIVILSSYFLLVAYLNSKNIYLISATLFLLFVALMMPLFPRLLRRLLFKTGILSKHK